MTTFKNIPLPAEYRKRRDGSLLMSFGNPVAGPHEQFDFDGSEAIAAAIVEAVNALSTSTERSAVGVKVKPLEWACSPEWKPGEFVAEWFVFSIAGHYHVWCDQTVDPELWHVSYPSGSKQPYEGSEHASLEAAKAAAQSDYEARILSALVMETGEAEPVAWLVNHKRSSGAGSFFHEEPLFGENWDREDYIVTPLYTSPPSLPAPDDRLERLVKALEPFANAVFNDNGDITVDRSFATYDDFARAYFAHKEARAALAAVKEAK